MRMLFATMIGAGILTAAMGRAQGELIIHYPLNETSGTTISDSSGNGLDLTAAVSPYTPTFGSASPAPGSTASIQNTDSGGDYRRDGLSATDIGVLESFTAMAWILDAPAGTGNSTPFLFSHSGGPVRLGFNVGESTLRMRFVLPGSEQEESSTIQSADLSGWHNYAWVFDGAAGELTYYIDGVVVDTGSTVNANTGGPPVRVGLLSNTTSSGFDQPLTNFVDDFWYFGSTDDSSGALSQHEIQAIAGIPEPPAMILVMLGLGIMAVIIGWKRSDVRRRLSSVK